MRYVCCDATEGGEVADGCPVTNSNDPPLHFINTHVDWFFQHQSVGQTTSGNTAAGEVGGDDRVGGSSSDESVVVALIVGDVQAHDESQDYMQQDWIDNIYESAATVLQVLE